MNNLSEEEQLKARIKELDELVDELTSILDLKKETIVEMQNAYETLNAHDEMLITTVDKLKEENKKLITILKMVENNSLMPHKHEDYYTRLCCLSERASEVLKEIGEE